MFNLTTNIFARSKKEQVKKINEEVSESIVNGLPEMYSKIFSAADLWSIQRKRKMMVQRRWAI